MIFIRKRYVSLLWNVFQSILLLAAKLLPERCHRLHQLAKGIQQHTTDLSDDKSYGPCQQDDHE